MTRWLAGRFAAKEAARKAAPGGAASLGWKDVVVRVPEESEMMDKAGDMGNGVLAAQEGTSRRPEIVFLGGGEGRPDRLGRLSISHDGDYVVATVLAAG
jgi:holo-[acyl-carrier protein] synthase